ncbi:MAG: prolipoprotein diacylglyceryl transferase [Candidatus Omnitrophica bacterium CG11_big_fil_rev_8_21_14_0_20_42_13]|uniref:Phosphatidylglycerol--prolipoprotein diacylglyceryl transferase n=1 Tax=Candidatus Ghiorseimicrobium undicola TaxID=1974746 RepID=A0A2H0LX95_9BACT|nr:MAG: prolipoprotein diacylglyceryl transferase [Candidatus Omnitrophica bacterium CG11_big_fil_rev_8_21_14_0_20_42_13]
MYPVLFKIGPVTVYSYGFFLALAFLAVAFLAGAEAKRRGIDASVISTFCFACLISGIAGARLLFIILNITFFLDNPVEIIMLQHGGLVWYGGLISAVACGIIYLLIKRQDILSVLDLIMPYIALGQSIGRIGCFLNGCCYGKFCRVLSIPYPTQIFSSLLLLLIFVVLRLAQKGKLKKGTVTLSYFIFYPLARFFVEFLRADNPPIVFNLTISQIISVVIFVIALILFCARKPLSKKA